MPAGHQDAAHPGFVGKAERFDCRRCIAFHADIHAFPMTTPIDELAWAIYQQVEDQQRIGMDAIGLDYAVLPPVFDLYGVSRDPDERRFLFEQIVILNRASQAERARQRALKEAQARAEAEAAKFNG